MRAAGFLAVVLVVLALTGCGGETFGVAAEKWCKHRWPKDQQVRCLKTLLQHGPKFLEAIEFRESVEGLRLFHP